MSDSDGGRGQLAERADGLVVEFDDWAAGRGLAVDPFVVEAALDSRVSGDGVLTRWDGADIEELMLGWFPRKVTLERSEWPQVVTTLHAWVDFLAETRGGEAAGRHAVIDRTGPGFLAAMADERRYGPAKFWVARMVEHGVDTEDGDAVSGFLRAVHAGEVDYDQEVLAGIMAAHVPDGEDDGDLGDLGDPGDPVLLPPVLVPSDAEVASLAEVTGVVVGIRALVAWVGAGRPVTATKRLRVADARELAGLVGVDGQYLERARSSADLPGVSLLLAWAKAARVVRVVKGRLVPVKSGAGVLGRPVELWRRAIAVFPELGPAVCAPVGHWDVPSLMAQLLPDVALDLWVVLHSAGGTPVPVELLAESVGEMVSTRYDLGGPLVGLQETLWRRDFDDVLAAAVTLGAVELSVSDDGERDKIVELSGNDDPDPTLARLTPLGLWGTRELLRAEGFHAPSVEELAEAPLERVLEALRHGGPDLVESVLAAWVGVRGAEVAAAELAMFCVDGVSASVRSAAWVGMAHTGEPGVVRARELRSGGGLAGAMAAEWLVGYDGQAPESVGHGERQLVLSERFAALHDGGLLIEELVGCPPRDQLDRVRGIVSADHPDRVAMLTTISRAHPERVVAAAADEGLSGRPPTS